MADISVGIDGRVGRITLQRPHALNALTHAMCHEVSQALDNWKHDPSVEMVLIDAEGEKAFCSGGDVSEMYRTGTEGDLEYGRQFWRDEYRLNAKLATWPKPIATFMQGYTMGGGVGLGCHASIRVVGTTSRIAMPECAIGLVPDVGGSYLLSNAPGSVGEYLAITGERFSAGDAIEFGFADHFIQEWVWADLYEDLSRNPDPGLIVEAAEDAPLQNIAGVTEFIDDIFSRPTLPEICEDLAEADDPIARTSLKSIAKNSPLSMSVALELVRRQRSSISIQEALEMEFRITHRIMEHGDFLEGIRAQIVDKDRSPKWRHPNVESVSRKDIDSLLAPLGDEALDLDSTN